MKIMFTILLINFFCFSQIKGNQDIDIGNLIDSIEVIGMHKLKYDINIYCYDSTLYDITYTGKIGIIQKFEFKKSSRYEKTGRSYFYSNSEKQFSFSLEDLLKTEINKVNEIPYTIRNLKGILYLGYNSKDVKCILEKECFIKLFNENLKQHKLFFYRVGALFQRSVWGDYYMSMDFRKEDINEIKVFNNQQLIFRVSGKELLEIQKN